MTEPRSAAYQPDLEREYAVVKAAERLALQALRWLPYSDEVPEHLLAEWAADKALIENDLDFVRRRLKDAELQVLVAAQERGEARVG